jgi:hypothetical protein
MKIETVINLVAVSIVLMTSMNTAIADNHLNDIDGENHIALYYSDESAPSYGIQAVNKKLLEVGVRVTQVHIPAEAKPILHASKHSAITMKEAEQLIQHFHLGRRELVNQIVAAGREPEMHRGGYLQTSEEGVAPYPKVYDMMALNHETTVFLQHKFGKLHVNSSEAGVGIDEVMTIVSGGPYTWFFVFKDNVVGKLHFGEVSENGKAWRISYPGLVPHGGYFDAANGLVVAYAHGPEHFVMRYEDHSVEGHQTLGDNPWIDFTTTEPVLMTKPKQVSNVLKEE